MTEWTPRWFNKPKFHIILHLVPHIRRFGPASLFATEAFESFNAVIRAKSVHSNHHAPSRDIARAFAHGNRIRHMLSGARIRFRLGADPHNNVKGVSMRSQEHEPLATPTAISESWQEVGPGPQDLVARPDIISEYLGLKFDSSSPILGESPLPTSKACKHSTAISGQCIRDQAPARPYLSTKTGREMPHSMSRDVSQAVLAANSFYTNKSVTLFNGDRCKVGSWVLVNDGSPAFRVCRIEEIINRVNSQCSKLSQPDAILLQVGETSGFAADYRMPSIQPGNTYILQPVSACIPISSKCPIRLIVKQALLCAANLQHRCNIHACTPSDFRYVRQEGQATSRTQAWVSHKVPDDLLLNTARMRDAALMERLRYPIDAATIDLDASIYRGARVEIDARKAAALANSQSSSTSRGGRGGRGGPGGANRGANQSRGRQ